MKREKRERRPRTRFEKIVIVVLLTAAATVITALLGALIGHWA